MYDYFMRGKALASSQMFLGHFKWPKRICLAHDMRSAYSVGDYNGIFKWMFYGDSSMPDDLLAYCEELPNVREAMANMTDEEKEKMRAEEGMFGQEELANYTQTQIDNLNANGLDAAGLSHINN